MLRKLISALSYCSKYRNSAWHGDTHEWSQDGACSSVAIYYRSVRLCCCCREGTTRKMQPCMPIVCSIFLSHA